MPNKSYQSGYYFEKRVQAWLVHLGECTRSMMSRGSDLLLRITIRFWKVSCKWRAKDTSNPITIRILEEELEKHDFFVWGTKRGIPYIAATLPTFTEFGRDLLGKAEAQDHQEMMRG